MQLIMPAPTLALSSNPNFIPAFSNPPVDDSLPSSLTSPCPTIADHSSSHGSSPAACTDQQPAHHHHPLTAVQEPTPAPLCLRMQLPARSDHPPSHSCRFCSRSFSCGRALGGHMRAHGSFYALCEGAGSSADMAKSDDHRHADHQHSIIMKEDEQFVMEPHGVNLSSSFRSEMDDQYDEEDEEIGQDADFIYSLRRNPKRSRRFTDQDPNSEEEAMGNNSTIDGGDDPDNQFGISRPAAASCKKPLFTKLQEKGPPAACTECGKGFSSWKALFGHMRCHPEREWRGIQPPAAKYGMKAHKDSIARMNNTESSRYIVVKPVNSGIKNGSERRKEMANHCRSSPSSSLYHHEVNKAKDESGADDSILGCIREDELLPWNECRKQVMLEEEEESETESIEAAYMSNKDDAGKALHLLASLPRGKRSKRSHFTIKSLRSVQDHLAADIPPVEAAPPKEEDLEMAKCLVMLALAGSALEREKQEGSPAFKESDADADADAEPDDDDDDDDDDEGTVDDQLRLTWGKKLCNNTTADAPSKTLDVRNNVDDITSAAESGKYECAACKRSFKSHQALGGHRASHKKVKGCFAKTAGDVEAGTTSTFLGTSMLTLAGICKDQVATSGAYLGTSMADMAVDCKYLIATSSTYVGTSAHDKAAGINSSGGPNVARREGAGGPSRAESGQLQLLLDSVEHAATSKSSKQTLHNPSKYHECSICHRVFSTGQALGGHKRCHWAADRAAGSAERHIMAMSEMGTAISAMACVSVPAKLTFFKTPHLAEEEVKVLDIDLNLPAPLDVDPCKYNNTLGSLLTLGQSSASVTIHAPIDLDEYDDLHSSLQLGMNAHCASNNPGGFSTTSSPSSTTSNPVSEIAPSL